MPVSFTEIDRAAVLCEIVAMRDDLVPDVSLGTHFFNDLVEMDILYLAVFPGRKQDLCNYDFFEAAPNQLANLIPEAAAWSPVLHVLDMPRQSPTEPCLRLLADTMEQKSLCYQMRMPAGRGVLSTGAGGTAPPAASRRSVPRVVESPATLVGGVRGPTRKRDDPHGGTIRVPGVWSWGAAWEASRGCG